MSWAGKKSFKDSFRSLFTPKEQAPSFSVSASSAPLLPETVARVERLLQAWENGKGYRLPDRTLEEAALRIGTDSATLYKYFSMRGEDFRTYRSRLRIHDAQQMMLEEPETPVSALAMRVGFRDRSNFNNQFKAIIGLTPAVWRRQQSNRDE